MTDETNPEETLPFELIVGGDEGIDNADVPVRWCITRELVSKMEEDGIKDPHILIVSVDPKNEKNRGEMSRHMLTVAELMVYVRFKRAGKMKLYAWILDGEKGRKYLFDKYMRKCGRGYDRMVIGYGNRPLHDMEDSAYATTETDVNIPTDVFGPEPNPTLKWFINKWHKGTPDDQCHNRERFLIATLGCKWLPLLMWAFLIVCARFLICGVMTLIGYQHLVQWKYVWRPFKYTMLMCFVDDDAIDAHKIHGRDRFDLFWSQTKMQVLSQRFLWWREEKSGGLLIHFSMLPFTPVIPLLVFGLTALFGGWPLATIVTIHTLAWLFGICVVIDLFIEAVLLLANYGKQWAVDPTASAFDGFYAKWKTFDEWMSDNGYWPITLVIGLAILAVFAAWIVYISWFWMKFLLAGLAALGALVFGYLKAMEWAFSMNTIAVEDNDVSEIRELLCRADKMNTMAAVKYIPREQRTFKLYFRWLKNAVCKPMQQ